MHSFWRRCISSCLSIVLLPPPAPPPPPPPPAPSPLPTHPELCGPHGRAPGGVGGEGEPGSRVALAHIPGCEDSAVQCRGGYLGRGSTRATTTTSTMLHMCHAVPVPHHLSSDAGFCRLMQGVQVTNCWLLLPHGCRLCCCFSELEGWVAGTYIAPGALVYSHPRSAPTGQCQGH
jgi:hypothetical protein